MEASDLAMLVLILSVQIVFIRPLNIENTERALLSLTTILLALCAWARVRESQGLEREAARTGMVHGWRVFRVLTFECLIPIIC